MIGDFTPGKTIRCFFNTHQADGTPITLAGTPAVSVYKDGGTTESTSGVTLTVDFDSRTGLHLIAVDTSADGTFYSAGSDFTLVITTGTVDSISVVGTVVGSFSLSNRSALRPTTADRTLVVSAGGEVTVGTNSDKTGYTLSNTGIDALYTRQLTEAYSAVGAAPTVSQALFLILQRLTEFSISGTTITINKLDQSTAAFTLTLNDATSPTSSTRAT